MQALNERLIFTLETVHHRLSEVSPLLHRIVSQTEHSHAWWDMVSGTNVAAELKQRLFQFLNLVFLLRQDCLRFLQICNLWR